MNQNNLNYSGQYLDDKYFKIKIATGGDIYKAAEAAVAGEMFLVTGAQPALYAAKSTSTFSDGIADYDIYKVKDLTNVPKIKNVSLMEFPGITTRFNDYSLSFDGVDDFVNLGSSTGFDSLSEFTISAWIKADSFSGYPMILAKTNGTTAEAFQFYIDQDTSKPTFAVNFSDFNSSTDAISTGVWTHIAVTWTSGTGAVAFYINGNASGTATGSTSITANTEDCCIGAKPSGSGFSNFFNGIMDEVSFFNSALSASDITAIYNSGAPADLTSYSPVSWWRMGDAENGSGTTITDQGSGGNDGTINGATFSNDIPQ
jgi:hypothetical protein